MSFTAVFLPILAALNFAKVDILPDLYWNHAQNDQQQVFINDYISRSDEFLAKTSAAEVSGITSWNHEVINNFLSQRGFSLQLEELSSDEFGVAAILNVLVKWKKPGRKTRIKYNNQNYTAVCLKTDFNIFSSNEYVNPVLQVDTQSGDKVYITIAGTSLESFELLNFAKSISESETQKITHNYANAIFPMVNLDQQVDISWLIGMKGSCNSGDSEITISQAKQQTKFQMNEEGAAAQSAVAMGMTCECSIMSRLPDFVIDKPFYLWIERPGLDTPLFAAYIDTSDWKQPAKLG